MGEVYLAQDTKLERPVALKFLPEWLSQDDQARENLVSEARAASKLNHPNIVSIHAVEEIDDKVFIVMEHVEGESLKELSAGPDLTLEKIIDVADQIADGLAAAHGRGIVHRDIKSENIIVTSTGQVKVLDFGLAFSGDSPRIVDKDSTAGTMAYMSPEQLQGEKVDHRSDIFSFGVVLYELITGRLPFKGDYEASLIYSIVNEQPEPLNRYRPDAPDRLQGIISRALEKDPAKRYQSIPDLRSDLKQISEGAAMDGNLITAGRRRRYFRAIFALLVLAAALLVVFKLVPGIFGDGTGELKTIAILPFDNLGQEEDTFFANAVAGEITTQLTKVGGLNVISRASAMQYRQSGKGACEFARELRADYVLEGTVYWDKSGDVSSVMITANLIVVKNQTQKWSESYVRDFDQIFDVLAEIASNVADSLNVHIPELVRLYMEEAPTDSLDAYIHYMRGNEYFSRSWSEQDLKIAIDMYQQAVESDPGFALAYAALSSGHSAMYREFYDRTNRRIEKAKRAVDRALDLEPDLPEAHFASGMYYYSSLQLDSALVELTFAQRRQPNNSEIYSALGGVQRRQGKIDSALVNYQMAFKLNPLSPLKAFDISYTYGLIREYSLAREYLDRAVSIAPDWALPYVYKAWLYLFCEGSKEDAARVLDEASGKVDLAQTEYREYYWWLSRILDDDFSRTLERITPGTDTTSYYLYRARIYGFMNQPRLKEAYSDSARMMLEDRVKSQPNEARYHSQLGLAYAGLGQKKMAISEGTKAVELVAASGEAQNAQFWVANLAEIYVLTGEFDSAVETLGMLLSIPGFASPQYLKIDPLWTPLKDHPGFLELVEQNNDARAAQ